MLQQSVYESPMINNETNNVNTISNNNTCSGSGTNVCNGMSKNIQGLDISSKDVWNDGAEIEPKSVDVGNGSFRRNLTQSKKMKKTSGNSKIPFWSKDPNILFQQPYIFEFFPVKNMTYEQKLNAITRTVIVLTVITFIYTRSTRLIAVAAVTLLAIFLLHYADKSNHTANPKMNSIKNMMEGFSNQDLESAILLDNENSVKSIGGGFFTQDPMLKHQGNDYKYTPIETTFLPPEPPNPLGNVLLTDYDFNPNKRPAPPAYTEQVSDDILAQTKKMISDANPGQPDIADKLFKDLADEFVFEQSMQPFYSTANTMIPNDQSGFAQFCYGDMISCKENNMFACGKTFPRYQQ